MERRSVVIASLVLLGCVASAQAAEFKVVANRSVPVASLTKSALSSAFLKKTEKWSDGTVIVPVEQAHDSTLRQAFCRQIHDKSITMMDAFWQKQVFSGRATPPLTKTGDGDVIAFLKANPGAIGYVSPAADITGLKEIAVE